MSRDTNGKNYPVLGLSLGAGAINQLNLQLWTKNLKRFTKSQSVKDGK